MSAFIYLTELADLAQAGDIRLSSWDGATDTPVASDTAFPIANLTTSDITELWKSSSLDGGASGGDPILKYLLTIDLGAASSPPATQPWDLVAMINHDFVQDETAFFLYSGASDSLPAMTLRGEFTWREFDMYVRLAAPLTDRYIKIWFGNIATWVASMGRVMVGLSTVNPVPPKYGWSISPVTKASDNRSAFNVKHVEVFCQYHQLNFPFPVSLNTPAAAFMTFLKSLQGMRYWFFLIPDSTESDAYVVRMVSQPRRIRGVISHNEFDDVTVEEESRGVRIGA